MPSFTLRWSGGSTKGNPLSRPVLWPHLQDHRSQVRAQDFRLGERAAGVEVFFRVEPHADARPEAATTPAAGWPKPARWPRWAGAAPWCAGCSGKCERYPCRPRNARRARSATFPPRSWPGPLDARRELRIPGAARPTKDGRTGAGFPTVPIRLGKGVRRVPHLALAGQEDEDVTAPQRKARPPRYRPPAPRQPGPGQPARVSRARVSRAASAGLRRHRRRRPRAADGT